MKICIFLLITCFVTVVKGQDPSAYWKQWNTNYPFKNAIEVLNSEYAYAKNVEAHRSIAQYYVRKDGFRFKAIYMGKIKPVALDVKNSMKKVLLLTKSDTSVVDNLCQNAVLIKIGNNPIWMPIQKQVLEGLKDEAKQGDQILLYCAFLNEHTLSNKLYNNFVISEFVKQ